MTEQGAGNVALFSEDGDGNPLAWYVTRVASRSQIILLIQERGGEVLDRVVPADPDLKIVCVVSEKLTTPITLPEGMVIVTRQYIIDCVEQNTLLPFDRYAPNQGEVNVMLAPTTPQGRNAYTEEEDKALIDHVQQAVDMGHSEDGLKLYKLIAPHFPRHTFQSLRERYLRHLAPSQQCRLFTSSPIRSNRTAHLQSDPVTPSVLGTSPLKVRQDPKTDILDAEAAYKRESSVASSAPLISRLDNSAEESTTDIPSTAASTLMSLSNSTMPVKMPKGPVEFAENMNMLSQPLDQAEYSKSPQQHILIESDAPLQDSLTSPTLPTILSGSESPSSANQELFSDAQKKEFRQAIHWLTKVTQQPFEVVIFALYQFNGKVSEAHAYLLNPKSAPWRCEEDLALLDGSDRSKIDGIIDAHGVEHVKGRQAFLKAVCNNS